MAEITQDDENGKSSVSTSKTQKGKTQSGLGQRWQWGFLGAMSDDQMRYDLMTQEALRSVIRTALMTVKKSGLPGDHHFYIAFNTKAVGVRLSDRLSERYPEEMTIVMQHQFWGLEVTDDQFTIELSFDSIPEKLTVPFNAVKGFFDPAVQFGLQFENAEANENIEQGAEPHFDAPAPASVAGSPPKDGLAQENTKADVLSSPEPKLTSDHADLVDQRNIVKLDSFRK